MSLDLLDKTRRINRLLNDEDSDKIDFTDFCLELSRVLSVNVMLLSSKGKILGMKEKSGISVIPQLREKKRGEYVERVLQDRFMNILSTKENVNLMTLGFSQGEMQKFQGMIAPVSMAGVRLGTLFIYREQEPFSIDDIILTEYGTTVIGLAMQRAESEEITEEEHRERDVMAALGTLSKLERRAVMAVLEEMGDRKEGILVASRLADQVEITRSVIVNALKKCESAGVIQTKSSGMKGTTIHILNDLFCYDFIVQNLS